VFGGSLPAEIWNRFMSVAVQNDPVQDFVVPQFTGHTVSSPYSYVPTYPQTTTTTAATTTEVAPPPPPPHGQGHKGHGPKR
jgi:membrane carboxypeptidase/penicillin-binding protein